MTDSQSQTDRGSLVRILNRHMLRKCVAVILVIGYLDTSSTVRGQNPSGQANPAEAEQKMQRVRADLVKLRPGTKVIVSFVGGRWTQGKLHDVSGEGFRLESTKSGKKTSEHVALKDVESIVKVRQGLPYWAKIAIGAGVAVGVLLGIAAILAAMGYGS